jgi:thiol-disulfide isomerase/thioredoxin
MSKNLIITLSLSLLVLSGCSQAEQEQASQEVVDVLQLEEDIQPEQTEDTQEIENSEDEKLSEAQYVAYSEDALQEYQGQNKIIFFHAAWCTTCRALNAELEESISELPAGTVVLKADYDSETDLRQKYGVNLQHTLVFVDDEGNQTKNNLIGANLEGLKAAL